MELTAIDTVTNLVELIRIDNKESNTVARKLVQCWLTGYLWPQHCIHYPGTEFTGPEFQTLLQNCHIRDVCTTAKNPQSNAVCERMHQTVGDVSQISVPYEYVLLARPAKARRYLCTESDLGVS